MPRQQFESDLTRERFELVRGLLEGAKKKTRPRQHDLYDIFCAILYLLHTGGAWRSLPPEFPRWRTVHEYFTQWTEPRNGGASLLVEALQKSGETQALALLEKHLPHRHRVP